ncbi:hypothetical protein [Heyndrickxia sporothermodurans]|nr:hypothetical protein [Heyndrickxia sporothermodurans]
MKSALSDQVLDWVRKSVGSETEIRSIICERTASTGETMLYS